MRTTLRSNTSMSLARSTPEAAGGAGPEACLPLTVEPEGEVDAANTEGLLARMTGEGVRLSVREWTAKPRMQ